MGTIESHSAQFRRGVTPLLSVSEVAHRLGLRNDAVRRAVRRGELPAVKLCGRIRIDADDLHRWISRNRLKASPRAPTESDP